MDKEATNGENKKGENLSAVAKEQGYKKLSLTPDGLCLAIQKQPWTGVP